MTVFFYQLFIHLFQFLMRVAGLFSPKVKLGVQGRVGLLENLAHIFQEKVQGRPVAWFHAASLGEFEQGRPVIEAFRKEYPNYFILLTFFSPSGYEVRKNYGGADHICYLPMDTKSNATTFVDIVQPQVVFFIKYEFWYNYLHTLRESGALIYSFAAIFRPGQAFFKWYGGFYQHMLTYFDFIFVQNKRSLELLRSIGITRCVVGGDTRFDRVAQIAAQVKDLPEIARFVGDLPCMVAGSVWASDMAVVIPAVNALNRPLKMILAPHEIKREEMEGWRKQLSRSSVFYSDYVKGEGADAEILFIDNIGMLSSLYRYGSMAYIGGAFGSGLHNILEAATFGVPIAFGNKGYYKFQEAVDLIGEGGAVAVSDAHQLTQLISQWCDPVTAQKMGAIGKAYVHGRLGATEQVMRKLKESLKQSQSS